MILNEQSQSVLFLRFNLFINSETTHIFYSLANFDEILVTNNFNPIWTGLFANLKGLGRGKIHFAPPPPNLTISCQKTMKLGKRILWVEIFTNF